MRSIGGVRMSFARTAVGMSAIGGLQSAVSSYYGAKSQASQLAFEAEMSQLNARMADRAAESVLMSGRRDVQRSRMQTAALKGRQRVAMAAGGIALDEGSALALQTATDYLGEVDANTIEANAIAQAWGHRVEATNYRNSAARSTSAASAVSPSSAAMPSLVGSATQVAAMWYTSGLSTGKTSAPSTTSTGGGLKTTKVSGFWGSN